MKRLVGIESLSPPEAGVALTIGTFDGVHMGHRALIGRTLTEARERDILSAIVTWDRHPAQTLRPHRAPPLLTHPERKLELLADRAPDLLVVLAFDRALSQWPPERFVDQILVKGLNARSVFVGSGWRFGHKAAGDFALLKQLGGEFGFDAQELELEREAGDRVSSSRVRDAVSAGEMGLATTLLGRPFDLDGIVVPGDDRGKALGFPTANLELDPQLAHPRRGVYAGRARVEETWHPAAVNVGVNPTFGGNPDVHPLRVEAYLLDFDGDLYGRTLRVEFWKRLRDELAFASADDLVVQMRLDVEETRALVG